MKLYLNCFLIVLLSVCAHVQAQTPDLIFNHITVEEGLSQSSVFSITQDTSGFMWFGTRDGLNRYDGRNLEIFYSQPSSPKTISDNTVYSLLTDSKGRIWAGTRVGLNLYDARKNNFTRFMMDETNPHSLSSNSISYVFEDSRKNIWIGTRHGLNLLVENDSIFFLRFQHDEKNSNSIYNEEVRSIYEDRDGVLWIGSSEGFSKLDYRNPKQFAFTFFHVPGKRDVEASSNWVNAFVEVDEGKLLVGTEKSGILMFDKQNQKFVESPWKALSALDSKTIRSITRDNKNNYWIGTIGGLYIFNPASSVAQQYVNIPDNPSSISDNSVRATYVDKNGTYWIGTFHGGVSYYSPLAKQFKHFKTGKDWPNINFKVASAMLTDDHNNLWLSTEGNGLIYIDRKKNAARYYKHRADDASSLSHNNIKCLLMDNGKGLWIGTIKGLDYLDFKTQKFHHYTLGLRNDRVIQDGAVYSLLRDTDGNIWVGTYRGGLIRFNVKTHAFDQAYTSRTADASTLTSAGITSIYVDDNKNLWVGTVLGLNKKAAGDSGFTRYLPDSTDNRSIQGTYILCIFQDSKKRMWFGSRGEGLNLLMEDGRSFRNFTIKDGLPDNSVNGILEDPKGNLWLSTENGLAKFNPETFTCRTFNAKDGLACKEFNFNSFHHDEFGTMYFGGYNGVVFFHPDSIRENRIVPALAFTRLKIFNEEVSPAQPGNHVLKDRLNYTSQIELDYDQNIFSVEFAVLNFINAQKNQYAYKLDGFETNWNIVDEPVATYMNLRPGSYTLLVKGANNDGVWNEAPLALKISILPPPWKTWWAYCIYLGVFGLLLYIWSRLNRRKVELQHELEIEHLEKVKQEELHQAKLNFFTNVAHEIRTPLTLMVGPVEQLASRLHDPSIAKEIGLVKTNSDRLMRLLNQLLDFHKQETGNVRLRVRKEDFIDFIHETILPFQDFAHARKISIELNTEVPHIPLWFDRNELSKVFYNLLANAFKFTPGGGKVCVSITRELAEAEGSFNVLVTIEDNGLGISAAQLEKIFHRFYQAENTGIQEAGFGIGLALAKGIIDLHHGEIDVESREATNHEQGFTRFTITLRSGNTHFDQSQISYEQVKTDDTLKSETWIPAPENTEKTTVQGDRPLILIVEDHDDIRNYIRDILIHYYEVLEARNGLEGWELATENLPDLVVSDVMMPQLSGLDLVNKLKNDQRTSHIPVILLTARSTVNHQVEGLETGADDYLPKPFNVQLLLAKIKNHLAVREKLKEKYSRIVTLQPQHQEVEDPDDRFLQRLMAILEENIVNSDFNVSKLVREIGMSRPVLFRKTKMLTGLSVIDLIRNVRLKKAEMLLKQKKLSISEVAFTVGFSDPKYFSKTFRAHFGKTPSQYLEELG